MKGNIPAWAAWAAIAVVVVVLGLFAYNSLIAYPSARAKPGDIKIPAPPPPPPPRAGRV